MTQGQAEELAARALGWIAAQDDLLGVFMGASGIGIDQLRASAGSPETLLAVLDFLCMDDAWVLGFCEAESLPPETAMRARQVLAGPSEMHWT